MHPTEFEEQNDVLLAGENIETNPMPICRTFQLIPRGVEQVQIPVILSKWKLTEEELRYVNETGCIWLMVRGQTHPPLLVMAEHPFEQQT